MSEQFENPKPPAIKVAYNAALLADAGGRQRADAICISNGATPGMHIGGRVPANKVADATRHLEALAAAGTTTRDKPQRQKSFATGQPTTTADKLEGIRAKAYGETSAPKPSPKS